jgi:hypothetical protein
VVQDEVRGGLEIRIRELDASSGSPKLPHPSDRIIKNTLIFVNENMPLTVLTKFIIQEAKKNLKYNPDFYFRYFVR